MDTTFIYSLNCPTDHFPVYVGKSNDPKKRLYLHLIDKRVCRRKNWITGLRAKNLKPEVEIIDEIKMSEWPFWERHYISLYRSWGFNLLNVSDGGEGHSFHDKKVRRNFIGKNNPMYGLKRKFLSEMNSKNKGKSYDEIYGPELASKKKNKIIEWNKKYHKISEKGRARMSERMKGIVFSEETKRKMSQNQHKKGKFGSLSLDSKKVDQYTVDNVFVKTWGSISEARRFAPSISRALADSKRTSAGFKWKYHQ